MECKTLCPGQQKNSWLPAVRRRCKVQEQEGQASNLYQHPLLAEWDHPRNAAQGNFPDDTSLQSQKQIFWLCTKCPSGQEYSWAAQPSNRTGRQETGSPVCAGRVACKCNCLQTLYPGIAAEWDPSKNRGQPSDHPASSRHLAWWSNPQRGSWQQSIKSRTNNFRCFTISKQYQQRFLLLHPDTFAAGYVALACNSCVCQHMRCSQHLHCTQQAIIIAVWLQRCIVWISTYVTDYLGY